MKPKVELHGEREVNAALRRFGDDAADLSRTYQTIGDQLARDIGARTPIRTGILASSWRVVAGPAGVTVASDVPYAGPVETGVAARGMIGAHMAASALTAAEPAIVAALDGALTDAGKRADL